jgi:hypothetical protein
VLLALAELARRHADSDRNRRRLSPDEGTVLRSEISRRIPPAGVASKACDKYVTNMALSGYIPDDRRNNQASSDSAITISASYQCGIIMFLISKLCYIAEPDQMA